MSYLQPNAQLASEKAAWAFLWLRPRMPEHKLSGPVIVAIVQAGAAGNRPEAT